VVHVAFVNCYQMVTLVLWGVAPSGGNMTLGCAALVNMVTDRDLRVVPGLVSGRLGGGSRSGGAAMSWQGRVAIAPTTTANSSQPPDTGPAVAEHVVLLPDGAELKTVCRGADARGEAVR